MQAFRKITGAAACLGGLQWTFFFVSSVCSLSAQVMAIIIIVYGGGASVQSAQLKRHLALCKEPEQKRFARSFLLLLVGYSPCLSAAEK